MVPARAHRTTAAAQRLRHSGSGIPAEYEVEGRPPCRPRPRSRTLVQDSCTSRSEAEMTAVSISNARENLFPLVRQVNDDHVVIEIVARNGGNAILMSAEDYESLQETLYLFSTRANAVHILRGLAEARGGAAPPTGLEGLAAQFNVQADE